VNSAPVARREAWDLPTRVFHWTLATLVVFSFTTGQIGGAWMAWHLRSGYAILALLLFRLAWGVAGSPNARFTSFLRGPRAVAAHWREMLSGARAYPAGHNPMGAWMVVVLLATLLLQAGTGLFSDDESSHQGPLAVKVSNAVVERMSLIHGWNGWVIAGAVALHVAAVLFYQWGLKVDLIRAMVAGRNDARLARRATILFAIACGAVYALVVVYPR
jgi:cytochrome b